MSRQGALLCGWIPGILNTLALIAFALIGVIYLLVGGHELLTSQIVSLITLLIPLTVVIVLAAWVSADEHRLAKAVRRFRRFSNRLRRRKTSDADAHEAAARVVSARRLLIRGGWRAPALGAFANASFDLLTLVVLFVAARQPVNAGALLMGYGLPQLVGRITFLPGGLGVVEGGMVGVYAAFGVPTSVAVLVVLAYRGLSFWFPTLIGFALVAVLELESNTHSRGHGG
jgi:uncharacterized protein (TIRG00374 family)